MVLALILIIPLDIFCYVCYTGVSEDKLSLVFVENQLIFSTLIMPWVENGFLGFALLSSEIRFLPKEGRTRSRGGFSEGAARIIGSDL